MSKIAITLSSINEIIDAAEQFAQHLSEQDGPDQKPNRLLAADITRAVAEFRDAMEGVSGANLLVKVAQTENE